MKKSGFSLVELVLAIGIFALIGSIIVGAFIYGRQATQQAGDRNRAAELSSESLEAVRNIANPNYSNLSNYTNGTTYYIAITSNQWQLTTTPTSIDNFTRTVVFADGPNGSRQATVNVSWKISQTRNGAISATTYFANWRQPTSAPIKSGLLVYADGGTSTDRMQYKQLLSTGAWTGQTQVPDVSSTSSNRVPRSVKLYSAQTGSAKMMVSRHYDGSNQYIYATSWNGTSWSTPQLLAQWHSSTALNSGNFGGDFLADGTFVLVYYDGTNTPKSKSYIGTSWGPQVSLGSIGSNNNYITAMLVRAQPNTNNLMVVMLTVDYAVNTNFYSSSLWRGYTRHTNISTSNGSMDVAFNWSSTDNNKGNVVYSTSDNPRALRSRQFTIDSNGDGNWGNTITSSNIPNRQEIVSIRQIPRPSGNNEVIVCAKGDLTPGSIFCYELDPDAGGFVTPSNYVITTTTDGGGQSTFDVAYKYLNTDGGIIAYSDGTRSGKLKIYNSNTNTWTSNTIALTNASRPIGKTRLVGRPNSDEAMVIVSDELCNLYSVALDGTTNTLFTTPSGKAWTNHLATGPTNDAVWFDFAWDN